MKIYILVLIHVLSIGPLSSIEEPQCHGDHCDNAKIETATKHSYEKYYNYDKYYTEDSEEQAQEKKIDKDRWRFFRDNIVEALTDYKDCVGATCYLAQRKSDFRYWIDNGGIQKKDFLHAKEKQLGEHYQIINHRLFRQKTCIFPARCSGNEHFILKIINQLPDMEFIINTHDWPKVRKEGDTPSPVFSFSKTSKEMDILYPAWSFWEGGPAVWPIYPTGLGRWDLMAKDMEKAAVKWPWEMKTNRGYFRGSRTSSERDALVGLSWHDPRYVDAGYTKNQGYKSIGDTLGYPAAEEVPLDQHCKFKYLFNFRGIAASFRFKHLFLCKSLVFHVGFEWIEFFYTAMKPWVHYIPVNIGLNEVIDLIDFAKENDKIAQEIAMRGHDFIAKHVRMEDVEDYWFKILKRYGKLMKWNPVKEAGLIEIKKKS